MIGIEWRDTSVNVIRYTEIHDERGMTENTVRRRVADIYGLKISQVKILSIT